MPGAPARPCLAHAGAVQLKPAPGPPQPAHLSARRAPGIAQPFGGNDSFEIDPVQIGLTHGRGQPLPQAVLARMEAAFGADFSAVRVHVGPQASRIGAVAFTMGNDLYFAPGRFQPESVQGQQLIGHELAHVAQQRQGRVRAPGSGVAVVQDRALEAEADRLGMQAARRATVVQPRSAMGRGPFTGPAPTHAAWRGVVLRRTAAPGPPTPGMRRPIQAMLSSGTGGTPALATNLMTWFARARGDATIGSGTFTVDQFCDFVGGYGTIGSRSGQLRILHDLRNAGVLFPPIVGRVRAGLVLSLDSNQAQQAPAPASVITNRQAFGMGNPPHNHPNMIPLWEAHAHTPPPPGRDPLAHYMSPTRNYLIGDNDGNPVLDSSGAQVLEQGHRNLVMGHYPSASTYINNTGHQHSPGTNRQHNYSPSAYGQIENARASAGSGGHEPRYQSPSPTRGSWDGYFQSTHPRFREEYRGRWPSHIRTRCGSCGHDSDHETATYCSVCGAFY